MVNYQGPELIRPLVDFFEIPLFDRISHITCSVNFLSEIKLQRVDVARLHRLESIQVNRLRATPFDESEIQSVAELVPPCRLAGVETKDYQVNLELDPGFSSSCSAQ